MEQTNVSAIGIIRPACDASSTQKSAVSIDFHLPIGQGTRTEEIAVDIAGCDWRALCDPALCGAVGPDLDGIPTWVINHSDLAGIDQIMTLGFKFQADLICIQIDRGESDIGFLIHPKIIRSPVNIATIIDIHSMYGNGIP